MVLVLVVGLFHACWDVSVNSVVLFTTHFTLSYSDFSGLVGVCCVACCYILDLILVYLLLYCLGLCWLFWD